jgi:V8-like Glu-specific endopeptidase
MFARTRWPVAGLLAGVVTVGLTVLAPSAQAAPAAGDTSAASTTTAAMTPGAELASASEYWTPQRLAHAQLMTGPAGPSQPTHAGFRTGPPGSIAPTTGTKPVPQDRAAGHANSGGASTLAASTSPTVGKAFFHDPFYNKDLSCSASTLNSSSKQLVLTAGHCVHGGSGKMWYTNWIFIPDYSYGQPAPYGRWQGKSATTFTQWINSSDQNRDVAMVTVARDANGAGIVNVVGGNGFRWNLGFNVQVTILAYPTNAPYDGTTQHSCQGTTSQYGSEYMIALPCGFGKGASGGPWLISYDNTARVGYSNGTLSGGPDNSSWDVASYFDTEVYNMYMSQGSVT